MPFLWCRKGRRAFSDWMDPAGVLWSRVVRVSSRQAADKNAFGSASTSPITSSPPDSQQTTPALGSSRHWHSFATHQPHFVPSASDHRPSNTLRADAPCKRACQRECALRRPHRHQGNPDCVTPPNPRVQSSLFRDHNTPIPVPSPTSLLCRARSLPYHCARIVNCSVASLRARLWWSREACLLGPVAKKIAHHTTALPCDRDHKSRLRKCAAVAVANDRRSATTDKGLANFRIACALCTSCASSSPEAVGLGRRGKLAASDRPT
ncbi:hypothetical protein HDK90DRAFT_272036 [Phyllosticta capitalensis]|uniref:Uncharacterized protein n=1 Tax=Phyllosticta capitalensis TaxID=121624 RepID=A0ABR1YM92_9PEZI